MDAERGLNENPDLKRLHRETGAAWDVTAQVYVREEIADLALLREGGVSLLPAELAALRALLPGCRRAIHLQCAGGSDTLSLWNLGAKEVVGVDISAEMLRVARRKADALGAPARWVCCDVLDTPAEFDGSADLVYTGKGALPWMMDLEAWARTAARLLCPGGRLFIFEGHPLDWVWDMEASEYRLSRRCGDYFSHEVVTDRGWPIWSDPVLEHPERETLHVHERQWTLGDILNACIAAGLNLLRLEEHPEPFWNQFPNLNPNLTRRLPHTVLMVFKG